PSARGGAAGLVRSGASWYGRRRPRVLAVPGPPGARGAAGARAADLRRAQTAAAPSDAHAQRLAGGARGAVHGERPRQGRCGAHGHRGYALTASSRSRRAPSGPARLPARPDSRQPIAWALGLRELLQLPRRLLHALGRAPAPPP